MKFFLSLLIALTATLAAEAQCGAGGCSSGAGLFGRRAPATYYVPAVSAYTTPSNPLPTATVLPPQQVTVTTRAPQGHTHSCPRCGTTWDHASNPGHNCPKCGAAQYVQDSSPRPVTVFTRTYTPTVTVAKSKEPCPECEAAAAKRRADAALWAKNVVDKEIEEAKPVAKAALSTLEEVDIPPGHKLYRDQDGKLFLKKLMPAEATVTTGTEVATTGWVKTETGFQKVK